MGDSEHDGLPTEPILRGNEKTSNSRRTEESNQARQSSGADRPSDVSSLQGCTSGSESVGDSKNSNGKDGESSWDQERGNALRNRDNITIQGEHRGASSDPNEHQKCQAQSALGGDSDGSASRMDYAELCTSCDNRTDELRLLGNGVVPTTAERAFRTLLEELQ